jgi:hypothetical protein
VIASLTALVLAFASPGTFQRPADYGGGGGRLFTGSPSSKWDCSVCHDIDETLSMGLTADPPELLTEGYSPGKTYTLTITINASPNAGTFGLEVAGRNGAAAGQLGNVDLASLSADEACSRGGAKVDPVQVRPDGSAAQSGSCKAGLNRWHVRWTAPAAEAGGLTFYVSVVAGDGNAAATNDRTVSRVFGVPSPATVSQRSGGCGAPAAMLLLPVLGLLYRRRKGAIIALLLLVPLTAHAAKKKKAAPPPPAPVEQPAPAPQPPPAQELKPAPAPIAPPAPAPEPEPTPAPPTVVEPVALETPPPPAEDGPTAIEATAAAGFGLRGLTQYSASFATPVRVLMGFPTASVDVRFYPVRLLRAAVLTGVEVEGSYQVGWVLGSLPLGAAQAIPADGRLSAGYRFTLGGLSIAPRFLFRTEVGGVERNALFEDAFYQSVGGELSVAFERGGFFAEVRPFGTRIVDSGTASVKAYGALLTGFSTGTQAAAGWRFGKSGLAVTAHYSYSFTRAVFFGYGDRDYQTVTNVDQVHAAMITLGVAR